MSLDENVKRKIQSETEDTTKKIINDMKSKDGSQGSSKGQINEDEINAQEPLKMDNEPLLENFDVQNTSNQKEIQGPSSFKYEDISRAHKVQAVSDIEK